MIPLLRCGKVLQRRVITQMLNAVNEKNVVAVPRLLLRLPLCFLSKMITGILRPKKLVEILTSFAGRTEAWTVVALLTGLRGLRGLGGLELRL